MPKKTRREVVLGAASVAAAAVLPVVPAATMPEPSLNVSDGREHFILSSPTPEALLESCNRIAALPAEERERLRRECEAYRNEALRGDHPTAQEWEDHGVLAALQPGQQPRQ